MPLVDYLIQPGEMATPEAIDRKRKMAQMLALKGSDTSPVGHWSQGAARIVDALSGGLEDWRAGALEKNSSKFAQSALDGIAGALSGGGSAAASPAAGGAPVASGGPWTGGFDQAVKKVLGYEGGYTVDNGGPTNFGISSRANPDVDVRSLTPEKATALYKSRYWDAINGDQLAAQDPKLALVAFDTAVNAGPGTAQKLLAQSGGDPQRLLALRQQYNNRLIEQNPSEYGKYAKGWGNRLADLGQTIGGGEYQAVRPTPQMAGAGQYATPQSTPQQAPAGQYANADMPEAGAQPVQYQPPGGQPQQATQQGGMTRVQMIMQLSKAFPYMTDAQKQQAQMLINALPQAKDPVQAALEQEHLTKARNENSLFPDQQAKLRQDLQGGAPIDIAAKNATTAKTLAETARLGTTGDIDEYNFYSKQEREAGRQPKAFNDWMLDKRKAGAITIENKAESAEEGKRGSGLGDRLNAIADEGGKAQEDAVMFQRFGQLLGNVETGGKTALLEGIRQMTNGAVTLDPNVDNVQALNAAVQYLAPRLRVPGTGAQSDAELRNFMNSVPTLAGQPGGNKIILDSLQGLVRYKLQRAEIAQAWQSGEISGKEATKQIQALKSPFADLPKAPEKKAIPTSAPQGVDPKVWDVMTPEEKSLWAN